VKTDAEERTNGLELWVKDAGVDACGTQTLVQPQGNDVWHGANARGRLKGRPYCSSESSVNKLPDALSSIPRSFALELPV